VRARQDPASGRVLLALQLADTEAASMLEACARAALQPGTAAAPAAEPDAAPAGPGPAIRAPGARLALLHAYAAAARLAARLPDTRERPARMPLEPCGPSAAHGGDVIVAAVARGSGADGAGGAAAGGARAEAAAGLTRRGALARLAFLVDPPRGLVGRLLEAVRAAQGLAEAGFGLDRVWPGRDALHSRRRVWRSPPCSQLLIPDSSAHAHAVPQGRALTPAAPAGRRRAGRDERACGGRAGTAGRGRGRAGQPVRGRRARRAAGDHSLPGVRAPAGRAGGRAAARAVPPAPAGARRTPAQDPAGPGPARCPCASTRPGRAARPRGPRPRKYCGLAAHALQLPLPATGRSTPAGRSGCLLNCMLRCRLAAETASGYCHPVLH